MKNVAATRSDPTPFPFPTTTEAMAQLRWRVYVLLITVVVGMAVGRIFSAERLWEPSLFEHKWPTAAPQPLPTFGSNDRSRWATIRALVDHGTYAIGERDRSLLLPSAISVLAATNGLEAAVLADAGYRLRVDSTHTVWQQAGWDSGWDTVDKVLHPREYKFYSSKPPLLSTLAAGLYWLLQQLTGWTLADNPWAVVRTLLILVNVVPFAIYLLLLARLLERCTHDDWTRLFIFTAACFATLVTPFLITLNNHTLGTFSVFFALCASLPILTENRLEQDRGDTAPAGLFALAGLFASFAVISELPAAAFAAGLGLFLLVRSPRKTLLLFLPVACIPIAAMFLTNYLAIGQLDPAYSEFGSRWYLYEGSHWNNLGGTKTGIDFAHLYENHWQYALHVLVGHHGWFSLTPLWLLALAGMLLGTWAAHPAAGTQRLPWYFYPAVLLLSGIVIGFYLYGVDPRTRNYGGWTNGLRWLMWLTPLWLLSLLPAVERLSVSRLGRGLAYVLLALSVVSVNYSTWNPWRHPWLFRWMDSWGWIPY